MLKTADSSSRKERGLAQQIRHNMLRGMGATLIAATLFSAPIRLEAKEVPCGNNIKCLFADPSTDDKWGKLDNMIYNPHILFMLNKIHYILIQEEIIQKEIPQSEIESHITHIRVYKLDKLEGDSAKELSYEEKKRLAEKGILHDVLNALYKAQKAVITPPSLTK